MDNNQLVVWLTLLFVPLDLLHANGSSVAAFTTVQSSKTTTSDDTSITSDEASFPRTTAGNTLISSDASTNHRTTAGNTLITSDASTNHFGRTTSASATTKTIPFSSSPNSDNSSSIITTASGVSSTTAASSSTTIAASNETSRMTTWSSTSKSTNLPVSRSSASTAAESTSGRSTGGTTRDSSRKKSTTTTECLECHFRDSVFGTHGTLAFAISSSLPFLLLYALLMVICMPRLLDRRARTSNARGEDGLEAHGYRHKASTELGPLGPSETLMSSGETSENLFTPSSELPVTEQDAEQEEEETAANVSTFLLRHPSITPQDMPKKDSVTSTNHVRGSLDHGTETANEHRDLSYPTTIANRNAGDTGNDKTTQEESTFKVIVEDRNNGTQSLNWSKLPETTEKKTLTFDGQSSPSEIEV